MSQPSLLLLLFLFSACEQHNYQINDCFPANKKFSSKAEAIKEIPVPDGYERIISQPDSFGEWLRSVELKTDGLVYLYNGKLKANQTNHYAVLNIPVGNKDLQQCADAVMRLRAEYLFDEKRYDDIVFKDNNNKSYTWTGKNNRNSFEQYLETVFTYCNTASLQRQLKPVIYQNIQPGNVFIKGGFPGHAMIVVDVAMNKPGKKIFMLAQSYMPAQSIHIVRNPMCETLSPWYEVNEDEPIITPGWKFYHNQLYQF